MSEEITTVKEMNEEATSMVGEFDGLLEKIEYASPEMKKLWREIYQNSIDDRVRAMILFTDICQNIIGSEQGHTVHNKAANDYLTRMNKSNDQLLKLAQQIDEASDGIGDIDAEELYEQISKEKS